MGVCMRMCVGVSVRVTRSPYPLPIVVKWGPLVGGLQFETTVVIRREDTVCLSVYLTFFIAVSVLS